jgi:hypothetical protein
VEVSVLAEVDAAPEFWLSEAFVATVKKYEAPELKPVIVNELSFAPGWFAIVQLGWQVTV